MGLAGSVASLADLNDSAEAAALHAGHHLLKDEGAAILQKTPAGPGIGMDHFQDIRFLADIRIEGSRFPALLLDLRADLLGTITLGKIINGNFGAPGAKFQR